VLAVTVLARCDVDVRLPGDRLEVSVGLETIAIVLTGIWVAVVALATSVCRVAKWSDEATETALARAVAESRNAGIAHSPRDRQLRSLDLDHAAALLDVTPETLLAWEARYGFPLSSPSELRYNESDVLALRDGISGGASIAAAVARARDRTRRHRVPAGTWAPDHRDGGLAS
jgi:hypothetical protein